MNEVRLIDANALHKRIEMNLRASNPFTIEECCYKDALNSVDDAPTIDPETLQPTWRNPETDTMSPEDMAHYLMDFCHCHLAAGNGCPGCPFDKPTSNDGDGECRLGVPSDWDF